MILTMSLWKRMKSLSNENEALLIKVYQEADIPIEVRHFLASWIEVKVSEPEGQGYNFVDELRSQIDSQLPFFVRERLAPFHLALTQQYTINPHLLLEKFKSCIRKELELVRNEDQNGFHSHPSNMDTSSSHFMDNNENALEMDNAKAVQMLKLKSNGVYEMLRKLDSSQTQFRLAVEQFKARRGAEAGGYVEIYNEVFSDTEHEQEQLDKLKQLAQPIWNLYTYLQTELTNITSQLSSLQNGYLKENIQLWKFEQQRSIIGYPVTTDIHGIQHTAEDLADVAYSLREQLKHILQFESPVVSSYSPDSKQHFQELLTQATAVLQELAQLTFIIEHQPIPIIQKDTNFYLQSDKKPLTVGSLIAEKLNPRMIAPKVTVTLINATAAEHVFQNNGATDDLQRPIGTLKNNINPMGHCHPDRPHLAAEFQHISLATLANSRRTGTSELVTDKKSFLLCTTTFYAADMEFNVWTLSGPLVIITNVSQLPKAWATVLWVYGLSPINQKFEVSDRVSWTNILECINTFFRHLIGMSLTEEHNQYLTLKATKTGTGNQIETLDELCKERMEGRNFAFWDYFYNSTKLVKDHFQSEWKCCPIIGFIGKEKAESRLRSCNPWTFILRFSDSNPGSISIVCSIERGGTSEVCSLNPFNKEALKQRSLAGKISDLVELQYLYPHIPKGDVFKVSANPTLESRMEGYWPLIYRISLNWGLNTPDFDWTDVQNWLDSA